MAPAGFDANAEVIRGLQGSGFNVGDHYQVTGDGEGGFVVSIHVRDGVPIGTPDQRHADHERTGKQQLGADSVLFIHVYHLDPGWHVTSTVDDMECRESDPSGSKSADGPDLGGAVGDLAGKILKNGKLTASQKIREKRDSRRAAEAAAAPAKGAKGWLVLPLVGAAAALLVGAGAGAAAGLVPGTGARAGSTTARVGMVAPVASAIRPVTFEDIDTQLVLEGNIIPPRACPGFSPGPFPTVITLNLAHGAADATLKGGPTGHGRISPGGMLMTTSPEETLTVHLAVGSGPFQTHVVFDAAGGAGCVFDGNLPARAALTLTRPPVMLASVFTGPPLGPLTGSGRPTPDLNFPLVGLGAVLMLGSLATLGVAAKPAHGFLSDLDSEDAGMYSRPTGDPYVVWEGSHGEDGKPVPPGDSSGAPPDPSGRPGG